MSGWKDWAIGEVVTESDFQSFVQDQVVQRYADATERDTTLGANVAEGMIAYLEDTQKVQVYDGASWVDVGQEGDITSVTAGNALTGGGTSGDVTLNVDESAIEIPVAQISDLTATATELNTLDGITASTTELNYTDGVTSSIQDQLDDKADNSDFTGGTEGYTAVSNGASGLSYQPISHNYVINGAFDIWQRGTDPFTAGAQTYAADRWLFGRQASTSGSTFSQSTDAPINFQYSGKFQRDSGDTATNRMSITYRLEEAGYLLAGKEVTLSFYAKKGADFSGSAINFGLFSSSTDWGSATFNSDGRISGGNPDYTSNDSFASLTTSWERYTLTFTLATTANILLLNFWFGPTGTAGADDSVYITGVQLEAGSIATPFKRNANSIQGELAACQRYFQKLGSNANVAIGNGSNATSSEVRILIPLGVQMQRIPDITLSSSARLQGNGQIATVSSILDTAISGANIQIKIQPSSSLTGIRFVYSLTDVGATLDAEL